jgi:hypothetical protein
MFITRRTDKLIIPFILVIALFASSYRAKYHLRTEMPSGFFERENKSQKPSLEQKIAWAYWESAVMDVQWKYPYSHSLPTDPPAEFRVDASALGPKASDPATRDLYWRQLQRVWNEPDTWKKDYGWDFSWVSDPVASGGDWLRNTADHVFRIR